MNLVLHNPCFKGLGFTPVSMLIKATPWLVQTSHSLSVVLAKTRERDNLALELLFWVKR
jgi:hypothetical protein